jgi:hypothetical protein
MLRSLPPEGGWDVAAQATASPEHPAQTGSVAIALIAQPEQGDFGARSELVGVHEAVQALLGLPVLGLLTRGPVRPSVGTDARVIDHGARASRHGFMDVRYAPIATKFCLAPK